LTNQLWINVIAVLDAERGGKKKNSSGLWKLQMRRGFIQKSIAETVISNF
jgi:hypothetical protein